MPFRACVVTALQLSVGSVHGAGVVYSWFKDSNCLTFDHETVMEFWTCSSRGDGSAFAYSSCNTNNAKAHRQIYNYCEPAGTCGCRPDTSDNLDLGVCVKSASHG